MIFAFVLGKIDPCAGERRGPKIQGDEEYDGHHANCYSAAPIIDYTGYHAAPSLTTGFRPFDGHTVEKQKQNDHG